MAVSRLRRRGVAVAAVAAVALAGAVAAWAGTRSTSAAPPAITTQFGYIKSLTPKGAAYQLKLHPALFLTGSTADAAAVAAGVIKPGQHIDNDYYIVTLPAKLMLTYNVPASTPVTVISIQSRPMKITVKQLMQILKGTSPLKSKLIDPGPKFFFGYWLRIKNGDTTISIDQQFQP